MATGLLRWTFSKQKRAFLTAWIKFCAGARACASRQLKLEPALDDYWDEDMGSKVSCTIYLQGDLLQETDSPVVLDLNEVNRLFESPKIAGEFLPLLRSWHEEARRCDLLKKLRLIVLHSTEVYIPLKLTQSPFNVGLPVQLPCFTKEQVIALADRHGLDWTDGTCAERLMAMVGGHPYLVRLAFYHLCQGNVTPDRLLREAPTMAGIYKEYLRSLWATLQEHPELFAALKKVIETDESKVQLDPIVAYKLDSLGLVRLDGNSCTLSCELYRQFFNCLNLV